MNKKLFNPLLIFSLINLTILVTSLSAQTTESQQSSREHLPVKFKQPKPPPDAPKVGRGQGGASRGICHITNSISVNIIPLLPSGGWGLTASESPTLWMYVAYSNRWQEATPPTAELSVENRQTDTKLEPRIYPIELPQSSGIFSITLPHSLELNDWYRWYLVIACQRSSISIDDALQIEGVLQRRELNDPKHQTEFSTPSELINLYAANHLWYDAFHQAVLLHCEEEGDNKLKNYWQTLLKSDAVKLDKISDRPVICPD